MDKNKGLLIAGAAAALFLTSGAATAHNSQAGTSTNTSSMNKKGCGNKAGCGQVKGKSVCGSKSGCHHIKKKAKSGCSAKAKKGSSKSGCKGKSSCNAQSKAE